MCESVYELDYINFINFTNMFIEIKPCSIMMKIWSEFLMVIYLFTVKVQ